MTRKRPSKTRPLKTPPLRAVSRLEMASVSASGWPHRTTDRLFILAVLCSIVLHFLFLAVSRSWQISNVQDIEKEIGTLFKVKFRDLESLDFLSRPTHQQLVEERERVMEQEMTSLSDQGIHSAEGDLVASIPPLTGAETSQSNQVGDARDDFFVNDQTARNIIASDVGERAVQQFEAEAGQNAVVDEIQKNRLALLGRGGGSTRRLVEDLPEPSLTREPVAARTITMALLTDMAPGVPDLKIEEPPIELPSDTELLPSPEILPDLPASAPLKEEEKAIQAMKDRFIQLDDLVQVDLFTYHHVGGEGYFMVRIRPKAADERLQVLPKDVIFVLDASASMGRLRINVVKQGIEYILQKLRPVDRFNIIGFNQKVRRFTRDFAPVNEDSIKQALNFIKPLEATGMTDIYSSLQPLVQLGTERARPLVVLLFSDGRPTVGIVNGRKIINDLTRFQGPSTAIYCLGTGDEINKYLLDMLAFRNRGLVWFGPSRDDLPSLVGEVEQYLRDPVLLRVSTSIGSIDESEVYPKRLPDLYLQGELRLWGRLKGESKIPLRLVGEAFDEHKEMIVELPVPDYDNGTYEIARDWARSKIYNIAGKMVQEGEKPEYLDEISLLTRTYRVETPYSE